MVCGRFISFRIGRNILPLLTFGCPSDDIEKMPAFRNIVPTFDMEFVVLAVPSEAISKLFHLSPGKMAKP